jgi:hypothetical protein
VFTLAQLEQAVRDSWSLDTADEDDGWTPENPSRGQCDVTTLVVHDLVGGDLLAADVYLDGERIEAHMWNRLVSGIDVDLTRDQFRRGEVIGEPRVIQRTPAIADPAHPRYNRYEAYLVLSDRVRRRLGLDSLDPIRLDPGHVTSGASTSISPCSTSHDTASRAAASGS